jgi:hypothetical protein
MSDDCSATSFVLGVTVEEYERLRAENIHLRRAGMDRPSAELHEAALAELRAENERLRAEVLEQARLLGMSGEREAKLLARVEELERVVATVQNASADSTYLYRDEAINRLSIIRAALEAKP